MSFSTGSMAGWAYSIFSTPCLRITKLSVMPDCSGPGRYSAMSAMMSSKQLGLSRAMSSRMPPDSSWNTPMQSARCSSS